MTQETTTEFGKRFRAALETFALDYPDGYGVVTGFRNKMANMGREFTIQSVHKWHTGQSRPREDKIKFIAKALGCDPVWLSLGEMPTGSAVEVPHAAQLARGAVLVVAGLIEIAGGRVTYPELGRTDPRLAVSFEGQRFDVIVISPQADTGSVVSFILPAQVKGARIVAVINPPGTVKVRLFDLSGVPHTDLGGFSTLQVHKLSNGGWAGPGETKALVAMKSFRELCAA